MKCKAFTSLEQSCKLAEILPFKSADMYYSNVCPKGVMYSDSFRAGLSSYEDAVKMNKENIDFYLKGSDYKGVIAWEILPCWSLAALLGLLPKIIEIADNVYELSVYLYGLYYWNVNNGNLLLEVKGEDNLVDTCVAMIEKLHELKML